MNEMLVLRALDLLREYADHYRDCTSVGAYDKAAAILEAAVTGDETTLATLERHFKVYRKN